MMSREWWSLERETREQIAQYQRSAPVQIGALSKALGIKLSASTLKAGISGEIRPDETAAAGYVIRINRHDSERRQRFTVAHELGHFLLHKDQIGKGVIDDVLYRSNLSDRREAEANRVAADLLMPDHLIEDWLDRARSLGVVDIPFYLSERFGVSESALKIRLGLA